MRAQRRLSWDLIRVVAIAFVVTGHVTGIAASVPGIDAYPFSLDLRFGTVTLLVLSGYFIGPTLRRGAPGRWLRHRLARVLPAYFVALLVTYVAGRSLIVGFNGWSHPPGFWGFLFGAPLLPPAPAADALPPWHVPDGADLLVHGLLGQVWLPDSYEWIDGSWWTLPVQVLAFSGAALLWRCGVHRRLRPATVLWTVLAVSVCSPLLSLVYEPMPRATGLYYAYLFAAGLAIWLWQRDRLATGHLAALLAASAVLFALRASEPRLLTAACFAAMLGLLCLAARGGDWDIGPLRLLRRPVSWLAGISFGVYLVHQALGYMLARVLSEAGVGPWWLRLGLVVTAVVGMGWLLTVLVERPAYRVTTRPRTAQGDSAPASPEPPVSVGGAT